jgi:drug/metabolite transporter (DMT)-like permease
MRSTPPFLIIVSLIFVMFLWGGSFIAIKIGLRYLTPFELVMARFVPSAIMLLPIGLWAGKRSGRGGLTFWRSLNRKEQALAFVASFLAVPGYHICLNYGETLIPAGWASLVISLNPACIVLFASVLLHEKITLRRWGGIGVAFAGLLVITLGQDAPTESGHTASTLAKISGVVITLGAVVSWGAFTTISKKLMTGREPLENLGWIMTLGALFSLPAYHSGFMSKVSVGGSELFWALMFLSVGCTVFSFVIWFWALDKWSASRAGAFIYLVPLFALGIGAVMLNERVTMITMLGAAGVLGGVLIAASGRTTTKNEAV